MQVNHESADENLHCTDYRNANEKLRHRIAQWGLVALVVWSLVGFAVLGYFSGNVLSILSLPVAILVWTLIFVFTLRGGVSKLCSLGAPRGLAVAVCFIVLIAVVAVIALLLKPMFSVGGQIEEMINGFGGYIETVRSFVDGLYAAYPHVFADPTLSSWVDTALVNLGAAGEKALSGAAQSLVRFTSFTVNAIMCLMFALIASFWLLLEMPRMRGELGRLFGVRVIGSIDFLAETVSRVVGGFIKGMVFQCTIIGICCGIAYAFIGFQNGAVFAIIVGLCNILPVLGQWIALVIVVVACIFGDSFTAFLVILSTFIIQRIVYTFIYPKIMADSVDVHPVLIIIVMMIGYALGMAMSGVLGALVGILISIPSAAVAKAMFVYFFEKRTGRHLVAEDGVFFKGTPNSDARPDPAQNAVATIPLNYGPKLKLKGIGIRRSLKVKKDPGNQLVQDDQPIDADHQAGRKPTEENK